MKKYGSIYERSNGLLQGTVCCGGVRKVFYSHNRTELQDKMNDFVMEMKYNNVTSDNSVLFSSFVEMYLYTYKYGFIKDSSFDRLESIYKKHIKKSAIDIPLYKLDDVVVQTYLNSKRSCSKSTIKKIYDLVRAVLLYAYKKKRIDYDIACMLFLPKSLKETKHIEVYTDEEVDILCNEIKRIVSCSKDKKEMALFRYSPAFIIMLNTGLRAGEMLALEWSDVDLVHNVIHVHHTLNHVINRNESNKRYVDRIETVKTHNSIRDIPLNGICRECFCYLLLNQDGPYVVSNGNGTFLLLRSFQQTFQRICKVLGISCKGLHALRHTFASRLIAAGVSPKVVSDLLGHSSVVFTLNRYVHSYSADKVNAVKMLNDVQI